MFMGWNTSLGDDGLLERCGDAGEPGGWDAGAVLSVGDARCFEVTVDLPADRQVGQHTFVLGITRVCVARGEMAPEAWGHHLVDMFVCKNPPQCFALHDGGNCGYLLRWGDGSSRASVRIDVATSLSVRYRDGQVTFSSGEKGLGPYSVPSGDYYPCVFVYADALPVRVSRKRLRTARTTCEKLWTDRKFTDAIVTCRARRFPVHRGMLAAASPVFERMWEGQMREAEQATVDITDALPSVVEAMLQYIYTASAPTDVEPARLFLVAKKYELETLAEEAGRRMLESLNSENVWERARTLRLHAELGDEDAQSLWAQMYSKMAEDGGDLLRGLVEELLRSNALPQEILHPSTLAEASPPVPADVARIPS